MRPSLKLSPIEREHLQEVYNDVAVARDDLPYTEAFTRLCQEFQDRTFKNAEPEQVYGALLKYSRSGSMGSIDMTETALDEEQLKQLRILIARYGARAKMLPYSEEVENCRNEFRKSTGKELTAAEFWMELRHAIGGKRRPPKRKVKAVVAVAADDGSDDADEDGE